jgi:hypothetical protein
LNVLFVITGVNNAGDSWVKKVYARNVNALTEAKAFDLAPVGHNYQGRYNKSKKRITTNDGRVNTNVLVRRQYEGRHY